MVERDPLRTFVNRLARRPSTDEVYNPYRRRHLRENLYVWLSTLREEVEMPLMLVGEALGFRGGRLTGVPFSSARLLADAEHPFVERLRERLDIRDDESENTATMVWEYLVSRGVTPLCWNAFPFHPHRAGDPGTNRAPRREEIREGMLYLQKLEALFAPVRVVGVGRAGAECARLAFPRRDIARVRHPSFGGKRDFTAGMDDVLAARTEARARV